MTSGMEIKGGKNSGPAVYYNGKLIYDTAYNGMTARNINTEELKDYNPLFTTSKYWATEYVTGDKQRTSCTRGQLYNEGNSVISKDDILRIEHTRFYYEIRAGQIWLHNLNILDDSSTDEKALVADFSTDVKTSSSKGKTDSSVKTVAILKVEPYGSPLARYLNSFIATLSGNYITSDAYHADPQGDDKSAFTIIHKPIYGHVILRTVPENHFHLEYKRAENGALVGELARTRLLPLLEDAQAGETPGYAADGTPVYFSYYDPAGSGKQITKEEYVAYSQK